MCVCVWVTDMAQANSHIYRHKHTHCSCSSLAGLLFFMLHIFQGRAILAKPANGAIKWHGENGDLHCHLLKHPTCEQMLNVGLHNI